MTRSQLACSSSAAPVMQPFLPRNCGISCVFNCDDLLFIYAPINVMPAGGGGGEGEAGHRVGILIF